MRRRINRLNGGQRTVLEWDDFTAADGTALESHATGQGGLWTFHPTTSAGSATIDAGRVHNQAAGSVNLVYVSPFQPIRRDCRVSADLVVVTDNNTSTIGVMARVHPVDPKYYWLRYNTNGNAWQLFRIFGASAQMGTDVVQNLTPGQPYRVELRCIRRRLSVLVDGALVLSVVDPAPLFPGRAGLRTQNNAGAAAGAHLDRFLVTR